MIDYEVRVLSRRPASYGLSELAAFFVGVTGEHLIITIIAASFAYYLQFTLLIPAAFVGTIMAAARVWDGVNDLIMGTLIDKTNTRWGKSRPYLIFSPFFLSVFTLLCFTNFGFYDPSRSFFEGKNALIVFWSALVYLVWELISTMADVPLWGITTLMSESVKGRNRLLSVYRIGSMVGGGIGLMFMQSGALALGKILAPFFESGAGQNAPARAERAGFIIAAFVFSALGGVMFQMVGIFAKERVIPQQKTQSFKQSLGAVWRNKPFLRILLSGALGSPRTLLPMTVTPLITYYYAGKSPFVYVFFMALWGGTMFVGQFAAVVASPALSQRFSKIHVYNTVNIISVIPYLSLFFLYLSAPEKMTQAVYVAVSSLLFVLAGASNGFNSVLQSLLVADTVDLEEYRTGMRPDGLFLSGLTFISKLSVSLAALISALVYSIVGFSGQGVVEINNFIAQGGIPRLSPQYRPYMTALFFLVSVPPALGGLLSVIPTQKYPLSDEEHAQIVKELNKRRQANEKIRQENSEH